MPAFETTSASSAPPEAVWAFMLDTSKWTLFEGYGPIPGIVGATLDGEPAVGKRFRVENTDGSVHHERITTFEPYTRYAVTMEVAPPVSWVLAGVDETVWLEPTPAGGTRIRRRFDVRPAGFWAWPWTWVIARFLLPRAVERHNAASAAPGSPGVDPTSGGS